MFYKIHYGLVNIHPPHGTSPVTFTGRHDHQLKYAIPDATTECTDSYKFSFYSRTIRIWNQLPSIAVYTASLAAFQAAAVSCPTSHKGVEAASWLQDAVDQPFIFLTHPKFALLVLAKILHKYFSAPMPVTAHLHQS